MKRPGWQRALWLLAALGLAAVFAAYLRPTFIVDATNQLLALCSG